MSLFWNCVNIWVWNIPKAFTLDAEKVDLNIIFTNDVKTYFKSSTIVGFYFLHYCALYNYKPHLNGNDGTQKRPFRRIGCSPKTGKYGIPILFIFCAEVYIIQNIEIYLFFTKKRKEKRSINLISFCYQYFISEMCRSSLRQPGWYC